ncbi:MAG: pentapeptide repeat-containing protein [Parachlamydiaceae bacterium]|nr:pentapeptide repeat-containing protein [Parachlamydiaceae bacterium]
MIKRSSSLENQVIQSENFLKKTLENQIFNSCSFNSCDFSESLLRNAHFCTCTFTNCNLSLAKLDGCRFQDVRFVDCKIVGAEFFKCEKTFFSPKFENCLLHYCNFSDLNMKKISFVGNKLKECHFTNTNLISADFGEVDLYGTAFHNCDLFTSSVRYDFDPQTNKIRKAKFSLYEAVGLLRGFGITIV